MRKLAAGTFVLVAALLGLAGLERREPLPRAEGDLPVIGAGVVALPQLQLEVFAGLPAINCSGASAACSAASFTTTGNASAARFLGAAGSQGAPTFSFTDDPDTGIYNSGANVLELVTAGAKAVTINANGSLTFSGSSKVLVYDVSNVISLVSGVLNFDAAQPKVIINAAANTFKVQGAPAHSGNLQEWNVNGAAAVATMGPTGTLTAAGALIGATGASISGNTALTGSATLTVAAGAGTAGAGGTANETGGHRTFLHKWTVTHAALNDADTSEDEIIWTIPAKTKITRLIADVTEVVDGGAISDMDVVCGITAGGNTYLVTFDVDTAIGTFGDAEAELGTGLAGGIGSIPSWTATTDVQCRFTSVGGNLADATTGSITFYLEGTILP